MTASHQEDHDLADSLIHLHAKVVVFLGLGPGRHIHRFLSQWPDDLAQVIVIEQDPATFEKSGETIDWSRWHNDPRIHWFFGRNPEEFKQIFFEIFTATKMLYYFRAIEVVDYPPSLSTVPQRSYYENVIKSLQAGMEFRYQVATVDPEDSLVGLKNILSNSPIVYHTPNLDHLTGCLAGIPGIVVNAGPSLDASLPHLHGLERHAVVVATPSVTRRMINEEHLHPHLVAAMERVPMQTYVFREVHFNPEKTWLLAPPLLDPPAYRPFKSSILSVLRQLTLFEWFPSPYQRHFFGAQAGHLAVYALMKMGCNPIILLGTDLAYDRKTGTSHAQDIYRKQEPTQEYVKQIMGEPRIPVPGNNGLPIESNAEWQKLRDTYEYLFRSYPGTVLNAIPKESGASIPGVQQIEPAELRRLVSQIPDQEPSARLQLALRQAMPQAGYQWEETLRNLAVTTGQELSDIQTLCMQRIASGEPLSELYQSYQSLHFGSPARILLYDIVHGLDLDLMAAYHELPKIEHDPLVLDVARRELLRKGFLMLAQWSEKIAQTLASFCSKADQNSISFSP